MIAVQNLAKRFGSTLLFEDVTFTIGSKEKVGLVGRNGLGKTTLLKIIAGIEQPDEGSVSIPRHYTIGYMSQQLYFTKPVVRDEALSLLPESEQHEYWRAEKILSGLGFTTSDMLKRVHELSGGFQVRLQLAKTLILNPDMLLLDEPTNYLDITSIRWLARFLQNWPGELLFITHDRGFMDSIVTHTLGIHRNRIKKIKGNTQQFYEQIALEEEIYEKTRINDERRKKEIEEFISRFRAKARLANLVQSRIKTIEKMQKREKLVPLKNLDFEFRYKPINAKYVLQVDSISFGYDETPLIHNLSFSVAANDRICIIGPNGKGKTTLCKLLAGSLQPQSGTITRALGVETGYFEQTNISTLNPNATIEDEISYSDPDNNKQRARTICGSLLFEGDDALKPVSVLSGGEKSRVLLGKILVKPINLLILDEPSNHLDMEACDALLTAIDSFEGAVILVTHNELFLRAIAQRLIIFQNNTISIFEGDYERFLEKVGWVSESESTRTGDTDQPESKINKKELRRIRSQLLQQKQSECRPLQQRIEYIENEIMQYDNLLKQCNADIIIASQSQKSSEIQRLSIEINKLEKTLSSLYDELEELMELHEEKNRHYDRLIQEYA
ncbi:MAG TPA: ABC-F family ATP-binding cassette domain-containing protein [Spirochaetota bacterium]|nr:ABC-F family ATP-binding cassette domain-containing protein [Spirochaetota bacterium]HOM08593.1 ABC-F family ATP-binding cassette domain-containing protein [Spirochaetota bacterium]HPP48412.1 ABC-F family ATP-binding cassette domain-containing protein [Spirochaetota bacterium]HXK64740.1 ABC-F family ATP-binding cassette domain-containing protein [Spirochaetota bacterium]